MTPEQLHILQHSLGCDKYGHSTARSVRDEGDGRFGYYRNHYVIGSECDGFNDLCELVKMGYMKDHGSRDLTGGMHTFSVTQAGIMAMNEQSPEPPKISRSRQRYLDYLREDSSWSFGEWLRYGGWKKRYD